MVDLIKELKVGCKVKFGKIGGEATVSEVIVRTDGTIHVEFEETNSYYDYWTNGELNQTARGLLTITEVIQPEFDWGTVRLGMAFFKMAPSSEIIHYIGPALFYDRDKQSVRLRKDCAAVFWDSTDYLLYDKTFLARAPEHDMEGV